MTNPKEAYLAMKMVYEHYSGEKYNTPLPVEGKGCVKAIHYIQSFDPKDNVTPELAHRIAKAFARKTFGDDCQIVIATHIDKMLVHTHFILNSYSISGQKFNDNLTTEIKFVNVQTECALHLGFNRLFQIQDKAKHYLIMSGSIKRKVHHGNNKYGLILIN